MRTIQRFGTLAGLVMAGAIALSTAAIADETTTTTTTRTTQPGAPGVVIGVPGVAGVQIGGSPPEGCATRQTTHTNDETGDSVSHTATHCN